MNKDKIEQLAEQKAAQLVDMTHKNVGLDAGIIPKTRQQRRSQERSSKKQTIKRIEGKDTKPLTHPDNLQSPATISEVIQIATSVAMDVVNDYHKQSNPIIVSLSLHMEIFKEKMIENGWVTPEQFDEIFESSVREFNEIRKEQLNERQADDVADQSDSPSLVVEESKDDSTSE